MTDQGDDPRPVKADNEANAAALMMKEARKTVSLDMAGLHRRRRSPHGVRFICTNKGSSYLISNNKFTNLSYHIRQFNSRLTASTGCILASIC